MKIHFPISTIPNKRKFCKMCQDYLQLSLEKKASDKLVIALCVQECLGEQLVYSSVLRPITSLRVSFTNDLIPALVLPLSLKLGIAIASGIFFSRPFFSPHLRIFPLP